MNEFPQHEAMQNPEWKRVWFFDPLTSQRVAFRDIRWEGNDELSAFRYSLELAGLEAQYAELIAVVVNFSGSAPLVLAAGDRYKARRAAVLPFTLTVH